MTLRWILLAAVTLCVATGVGSEEPTASTPIASSPPLPPSACKSGGATRVSVVTRQNGTGHWLGDARVERAARPGPMAPLSIHLSHERRRCEDSASVVLHLQVEGLLDPVGEDYVFYKGLGYYKAHHEKATWVKAKTICETEGAHLLILNSEEEAEFIKKMVPSLGGVVFVGVHDILSEGHFITVLGERLETTGYVKWKANEPNGNTKENCVNIYGSGEMNDLSCNNRSYSFVCEHPQK